MIRSEAARDVIHTVLRAHNQLLENENRELRERVEAAEQSHARLTAAVIAEDIHAA